MASSLGIWNSVTSENNDIDFYGIFLSLLFCVFYLLLSIKEKFFLLLILIFFTAAMCIELNENRVFAKIISNS